MLQRARSMFGSGGGSLAGSAKETADEDALLDELRGLVSESWLQQLAGSSDLPCLSEPSVRCLLQRYLRAEKLSPQKAANRLHEQAAWRQQFGAVSEAHIAPHLELRKLFLQLPTAASSGRPLLIVKACRHNPGTSSLEVLQQFICYVLDTASHFCWHPDNADGKMMALFDLKAMRLANQDPAALRACFAMLSRHFPERMSVILMYESPAIFHVVWKVVEPFIDPVSRRKIQFVYGRAADEVLLKELGEEVVPVEYGGKAAEVPIEQAAQQVAAWRRQQQLQPLAAPAPGSAKQQQQQQQQQGEAGEGQQQAVQAVGAKEGDGGWHALRPSESAPTLPVSTGSTGMAAGA